MSDDVAQARAARHELLVYLERWLGLTPTHNAMILADAYAIAVTIAGQLRVYDKAFVLASTPAPTAGWVALRAAIEHGELLEEKEEA